MKPSFCLSAWLSLLAGSFVASWGKAQEQDAAPQPVLKAAAEMKIDGVLDEPAWKAATPVMTNYIWGKIGTRGQGEKMVSRFTWDDNYLYIGYETFDENLIALAAERKEGPKGRERQGLEISHPQQKVDVVEFFISFGDHNFFWEIHHNAANQFNDLWITNVDEAWTLNKSSLAPFGILFGFNDVMQDDEEAGYRLTVAAQPKAKADGKPSTVNDESDKDTGYVGELRLPWIALGVSRERETYITIEAKDGQPARRQHGPWKMAGQEMMIMSVFQNGDLEDRYHHSSPTFKGGWFHKGSHDWPKYVLTEK